MEGANSSGVHHFDSPELANWNPHLRDVLKKKLASSHPS
jgi:hypothetical protein